MAHITVTNAKEDSRLAPEWQKVLQRKDLGFWQLPERTGLYDAVTTTGRDLSERFSRLIVVGIGGSSLGARALLQALGTAAQQRRVLFIDHLDEVTLRDELSMQSLETCAFALVSKSGSTMETLIVAGWLERQAGVVLSAKNTVVVSEPKANPLTDWAKKRLIPQLEIPVDVGGRFSALTASGLLPLAFCGVDVLPLSDGAKRALAQPGPWLSLATALEESWKDQLWVTVLWSYHPRMELIGAWWQQLWAESLAKKVDRTGKAAQDVSTPLPLIGPRDQHSVLQQLMEGRKDKFIVYQRVQTSEMSQNPLGVTEFGDKLEFLHGQSVAAVLAAEAEATQKALATEGVPSVTLVLESLSGSSVGELLMGWQMVVACLGEALNLDAFNQPGVEAGKVLAQQALRMNPSRKA